MFELDEEFIFKTFHLFTVKNIKTQLKSQKIMFLEIFHDDRFLGLKD